MYEQVLTTIMHRDSRVTSQQTPRKTSLLLGIVVVLAAGTCWGNVTLPRLIGDHMVLQRDSKIAISGFGDPGEQVRVDFHGQRVTVRSDQNGRWSTSLGPFPAGGPYEMVVAGKNRLVLHDVLLGDVWLASGQSNMEARSG